MTIFFAFLLAYVFVDGIEKIVFKKQNMAFLPLSEKWLIKKLTYKLNPLQFFSLSGPSESSEKFSE